MTKKIPKAVDAAKVIDIRNVNYDLFPDNFKLLEHHAKDGELHDFYEQHNLFCMLLVLDGNFSMKVCQRNFNISQGQSFIIFPFQSHFYIKQSKNLHLYIILFNIKSYNWLNDLQFSVNPFCNSFATLAKNLSPCWTTTNDSHMQTYFISSFIVCYLQEILQKIKPVNIINKLDKIILQSSASELFPGIIAEKLNISETYLNRLANTKMKISISLFIREIKMAKSLQLLLQENSLLSEISQKLGFKNDSTFIFWFRNIYNITPGLFRKKWQNKNLFQICYHINSKTKKLNIFFENKKN